MEDKTSEFTMNVSEGNANEYDFPEGLIGMFIGIVVSFVIFFVISVFTEIFAVIITYIIPFYE